MSQTDNHGRNGDAGWHGRIDARRRTALSADNDVGKIETPGVDPPWAGTRASANTSGPDPIDQEVAAGIADLKQSAPNEENLFFFCRTSFDQRERPCEVRSSRLT
jgi:hypothetical protein